MNLFILSFSLMLHSINIDASFLHKIRNFLMGGKKGQPKTWEFVTESEIEYPGNNPEKLKYIQEIWEEYYNCLSSRYEDIGPYKSITPEAIMAFEGTYVKLDCKACIPPSYTTRTDDVQWNYRTIPPTDTKLVELGEHKFLSPEDKVLHMFDLTIEDTGQYFCQRGLTVTSAYFLEVVNSSEPIQEVQPEQSKEGPYSKSPKNDPLVDLEISTTWNKWSKCSTCGSVGKRVRYGICTVKRHKESLKTNNSTVFQQENILTENNNTTSKQNISNSIVNQESHGNKSHVSTPKVILVEKNKWNSTDAVEESVDEFSLNYLTIMKTLKKLNTIKQRHNISFRSQRAWSSAEDKENLALFNLFSNGVPCRSKILTKSISSIPEVQTRKSEITIGLCKEACPESTVFQVLDEKGNILESANNSAGIYSTLQGIPQEPPEIQRRTIYENTLTKRIALRCPGNLNTDVPIQWQIGTFNIDSVTVHIMSHGRIFINVLDQLIIMQPQVLDSNIYSCWQNGELAGTIRLIITKKLELNFNHQAMMASMIIILATFVIVMFRAFLGRNRLGAY